MGANEKHAATYHGGEYTPRLSHVRAGYVRTTRGAVGLEEAEAQFARWLNQIRAEAKAEALRDAADEVLGYDPRVSLRGIYAALKFRANQYKENQS